MNRQKNASGHWTETIDADAIAWLAFDAPGERNNLLTRAALDELAARIDSYADAPPAGLVIHSTKASGFIAGADIKMFTQMESAEQAQQLLDRAHAMFNKLASLPCPTLALIKGHCMGGGTELALACDYRIGVDPDEAAASQNETRLALPEIKLGIHPGFGGTARSMRVIGPLAALEMMLTGRALSARAACKLGLIDEVVAERHATTAAHARLLERPAVRRASAWKRLAHWPGIRQLITRWMRQQVAAKANPNHYPAPNALLDLWQAHAANEADMLAAEARSVARLIVTPTAQNLVRLFFLNARLKGLGNPKLLHVRHVHVVGAGIMGADIAAWCAACGFRVSLQDQQPAILARAVRRADALFSKKLRAPGAARAARDRFIPDQHGHGVRHAEVIIEAIFEDLSAKQTLFADLEKRARPSALLATNTSSLPLEQIAAGLNDPTRLVGLHFFNPVAQMPLVEVISSAQTQATRTDQALAFARQIDRLPLPVRSTPGFLVNRVLMPYLLEAVCLIEEGYRAEQIDRAATDFGMPLGPVELADRVGLDICLHVGSILAAQLPGSPPVPEILTDKVSNGLLGNKSGRGFYRWKDDKPLRDRRVAPAADADSLRERMIDRLLNECVACLREGVVTDADLIDAGLVFGTGFAPFRGGPMHYARQRGIDNITAQLDRLTNTLGERFSRDDGWAMLGK